MARTPMLERNTSLRVLGAAFIAFVLFFVWLTYAVFNKVFIDSVPVTVSASTAGLQLPLNADVKLRGMIIGEVRDVQPDGDGVELTVAMQPDKMNRIPRDVSAQIIPKTLFGEKFLSLELPEDPTGEMLQAGDNIAKAEVPIEVEKVLNDLYPLLEAVQPEELSYTLTAVSTALEGRGDEIGENLVRLNDYLTEINPEIPMLIDDLDKLGDVSDVYADSMPDLGRLLENAVVTGDTVVAKRTQLRAFFEEGAALSDLTTEFLDVNGDNIIGLAKESQPILQVLADRSSAFPCVLGGVANITPRLESVYRGGKTNINLELIPFDKQPDGYAADEFARAPSKAEVDAIPEAAPSCLGLPDGVSPKNGEPYSQENLADIPPFEVYQKTGIKTRHNKFFQNSSNRAAVGDAGADMVGLVRPSMGGNGDAVERNYVNSLIAPGLGMSDSQVPDIASLLVAPVMRGSEVRVDEVR